MKLYMTVAEIFEMEALLHRAELADSSEVEPAIAYLFLASYAEEAVRSIVKGMVVGDNFLTFIPPETAFIIENLRAMWGVDKVIPLHYYGMTCDISKDVRFYEIHEVLERTWRLSGLTPAEGAEKTKVSLLMNEIGNALICVEC